MMCVGAVCSWLQAWLKQAKARFRHRIEKLRAHHARKQWIKREFGTISSKHNYREYDFYTYSPSALNIQQPRHPYMPTTYHDDDTVDEGTSHSDTEQGVGVLSPQRLSQRLNENALAREAVGESDAELAQYLKDERIALFLQNDEFMDELRTNREFMTALQEDYESEAGDDDEIEGAEGKGQLAQLDDATLRERIATMGKASRKKFAQIAKVFSRRKRTSGRSLLPSAGRDQLLISADPLIEDEDDDRQPQQMEGGLSSSPRHLR
ncbi:CUE domain-containing protein 1-like [Homarus americanus]|uniref:CUE domain-containing protein 1-like n=1 Tax=Homarus americanus TaxID=6706 RepID=UPI001C448FD0|nr:CUE domain-containing protein 1-like [Homarus americanus]